MSGNRWLLILAAALALALCCCLSAWAVAALLWFDLQSLTHPSEVLLAPEPTTELALVRQPPTSAETETGRLVARASLPQRDLGELARRLQGLALTEEGTHIAASQPYELGDELSFWIHDVQTDSYFRATAILRYETPHAYWWIEEGYDVPEDDLTLSAEKFEERTYTTSRRYLGSEWNPGIDGDPHVFIFLGNVPGVGGYFSSPDEHPTIIRPHSNQHEIFYINLENAMPGSDYFDGILAHEFAHMIQWAIDRDEDTWVNEGLAELAGQINGYDVGDSPYEFGFQPDTQLNAWVELENSGPHYGASYLFLSYFLDRFGEGAVSRLVAEQTNGIQGFEAVLSERTQARTGQTGTRGSGHAAEPASDQFVDLFAGWVIANYLDDPSLAQGQFGYSAIDVEQPALTARHDAYPVEWRAKVHQFAADYILLEATADLTIEFTGTLVVSLVGNKAHSGSYQWWSHRGDDSNPTLTHPFDLTRLEKATLETWLWYSLETDYDYAYVEVSTDGGESWDLLGNDHTTREDPSGNSYGPAFNGQSGGGVEPVWTQETFELTPYVGHQVLIRFEVITDEALNYPGVCVDGIAIPELSYAYDADEGAGGWQADGWVRVTDQIPQDFVVQLITLGRKTQVQRIPLDEANHARVTLSGLGQEMDHAVLVVSAVTPVTTEPAVYSYRVTQQ